MRTANAQRLAVAAQNALVEDPYAVEIATVQPDRGALLALESLTTEPLPEGDAALRRALWRIAQPPLEIRLSEGESLISVAIGGSSVQIGEAVDETEVAAVRHYDIASGKWTVGGDGTSTSPSGRHLTMRISATLEAAPL